MFHACNPSIWGAEGLESGLAFIRPYLNTQKSKCKPAKSRSLPDVVSHSFTPVILPVERLRQEEFHELN